MISTDTKSDILESLIAGVPVERIHRFYRVTAEALAAARAEDPAFDAAMGEALAEGERERERADALARPVASPAPEPPRDVPAAVPPALRTTEAAPVDGLVTPSTHGGRATPIVAPPAPMTWAEAARQSAELERQRREAAPVVASPAPRAAVNAPPGGRFGAGGSSRSAARAAAAIDREDSAAPEWERIRSEARDEFGEGLLGLLLWQDARLVERGHHAMSAWWRWSLGELFASGKDWGVFEAGRGSGKALALGTPIATARGWTTMAEIKIGERVFDENGEPCNVIAMSDVQTDRECYEVEFSGGVKIVADAEHEWKVRHRGGWRAMIKCTADLVGGRFTVGRESLPKRTWHITHVRRVPSVPVRCITVDSPTHMFLAGRAMIPTHNSSTLERVALARALWIPRVVRPGQEWEWPFISCRVGDADRRLPSLQRMLSDAYGIAADVMKTKMTMTFTDASGNAGIKVMSLAGTIGNVSGPSTIGCTVDEEAKLSDGGANPSTELLISLIQTSRAREGWQGIRCSSAYRAQGSHYRSICEGSNEANYVASIGAEFLPAALEGFRDVARWEEAHGNTDAARRLRAWASTLHADSPHVPTWVANPTIGAVRIREKLEAVPLNADDLEGLDRTAYFMRENASMAMGGAAEWDGSIEVFGEASRYDEPRGNGGRDER